MSFLEPNTYCVFCGMILGCIFDFYKEKKELPVVLEIGCADGIGTMRYAGFTKKTICVDPMYNGRPDVYSKSSESEKEKNKIDNDKLNLFYERVKDFPVELVIGCSLWPEVISKVSSILGDTKIDILGIDGCHHPSEAVKGDFEAYVQFLANDGFVIFDDVYEKDVRDVYDEILLNTSFVEYDRWSVKEKSRLQDVAAIRKINATYTKNI